MGSRMKAQLVCNALTMAIWQRKPKAGLIIHSDQGVQYANHQYRRILRLHGFVGNISKKGCCWDNAVAESFFGSLKQEHVHWRNYQTRYAAKQDILNYITMYPLASQDTKSLSPHCALDPFNCGSILLSHNSLIILCICTQHH
jgi:putative transposase